MLTSIIDVMRRHTAAKVLIGVIVLWMGLLLWSQFYLEGPTVTRTADFRTLVMEMVTAVQREDWEMYRRLRPTSFAEDHPTFSELSRSSLSIIYAGVERVEIESVIPFPETWGQRKEINGALVYANGGKLPFQALLVRERSGWKFLSIGFPS